MTVALEPLLEANDYSWRPWFDVRQYLDKNWDPKNTPHHAIIGLTGSGKSYLAINGIMSVLPYDRVLIVDTKGDDEVSSVVGKPVRELPSNPWYQGLWKKETKPRDFWYRLVVHEDPVKARAQVGSALWRVHKEGNWVVYFDELYDITRARKPGLNLETLVDVMYRKGRHRKTSIIAATQSPAWVPRVFYDQSSFAWIGRIRDEQRQKRLLEIGGMTKKDLHIISTLQRRQWLLAADNGEFFARTKVTT